MRRVNFAGCNLDLTIPFVLTSKYCELIIHKCQPKTKSHNRLAKAVPYLEFESNFYFECPILGIRDNHRMKQRDNLPNELPLHLGYRGCSEPPCGVQAKRYQAFNNAASRRFFGNTAF